MATGTIIGGTGWSGIEILGNYEYGQLTGQYNSRIGMATLRWDGNATTPPNQQVLVDIPNRYKPIKNILSVMRNAGTLEARTDLTVHVQLTGLAWSFGSLTYPVT